MVETGPGGSGPIGVESAAADAVIVSAVPVQSIATPSASDVRLGRGRADVRVIVSILSGGFGVVEFGPEQRRRADLCPDRYCFSRRASTTLTFPFSIARLSSI